MKNNGKSLAQLIEKYIGKTGRRLFLLFCWLFCIIVIAAFTDMVCGTFAAPVVDVATKQVNAAKSYAAGCAGTISILFTFVAIAFGWAQKKFNLTGAAELVTGVVLMVLMFKAGYMKVLGNPWFATVVTLLPGLALAFGGYTNIWPLFGASNQLLGGMTMITLAVFCKCTGRKGWMLYVPVVFLLCCTFTSLVQSTMGCVAAIQAYGFFGTIPATATTAAASVAATKGLQLVFAVLLMVLGVIVAYNCLKEFFTKDAGSIPDEEPEWSEMGKAEYGKAAAAEAPADGAAQNA